MQRSATSIDMKAVIATIGAVTFLSAPLAVAAQTGQIAQTNPQATNTDSSNATAAPTGDPESQNSAASSGAGEKPAAAGNAAASAAASAAVTTPASAAQKAPSSSASKASASYAEHLGKFRVPSMGKDMPLLQGQVSKEGSSPFLSGKTEEIPAETKVDLVVPQGVMLNSEISQKGDEVLVRIAQDVKGGGGKVLLPGNWYIRGLVTEAVSQKRLGRAGYVEVQFDKLVSPDGEYEVDFNAKLSTKDNKLTAIAKVVATDAVYVGVGSGAGALLALQMSGIPLTIAAHGYNIAGGAAIGGTIGLIGALKRKGKIASIYGGDVLKLTTSEPIKLPGFDPAMLPSAQVVKPLEGLDITVKEFHFAKSPWEDRSAKLMEVNLDVTNNTNVYFHFFDLLVVNDQDQRYSPLPMANSKKDSTVAPGKSGTGKVVFLVGSPKRKYSLIFLSRRTGKELSRVAIN
jgi:hypothetical protein